VRLREGRGAGGLLVVSVSLGGDDAVNMRQLRLPVAIAGVGVQVRNN
jgi:hypothetical protein